MTDREWTAPVLEELSIPGGTASGQADDASDAGSPDDGFSVS